MTHPKQFSHALLGLCISIGLQANVSAATDAAADFQIMSQAEMAAHAAAMGSLTGAAREDYRNAQYQQLKKRALEHGFSLPADPPWAGAAAVEPPAQPDAPAPATATPAPAVDTVAETAARHAAMREKLEARREAMQQATEANLERLQKAASAQQQQVEAQLQAGQASEIQHLNEDISRSEAGAGLPSLPTPAIEPVVRPAPAAVTAPAPESTTTPVTADETAPTPATAVPMDASTPGPEPRFAPVEATAVIAPQPPVAPVPPAPPIRAASTPAHPPQNGSSADVTATASPGAAIGSDGRPYATSDAMAAYRETMRSRFDEYMQERQAQLEENARRQREQHEAAMEQNRSMQYNRGQFQQRPYPAMPAYGPRYPAAYPGYPAPYWQQR